MKSWRRVALVLAVVLVAATWLAISFQTGAVFDPVAWRDEPRVEAGIRRPMADDLLARGVLLQMTKSDVRKLLGEPTATNKFVDWDLVYWLDQERGLFAIDSEWLVLRLDGKGMVCEARIVRD